MEKLYLCKPANCKLKLETLLSNNHIDLQLSTLQQLRNYLYRYREKLIAENYPEVKKYLTEICQKTYSNELKEDELFFIDPEFENNKISILFTTRALVNNLLKQGQFQPSFIHLDSTYKLIDLGLPVITLTTENMAHNFRPVAYLIGWSESTEQITELLQKFCNFLQKHFQYYFKPKYILSDNSDAIISGCSKAFVHDYIHLLCHFHIMKGIKDKTRKNDLKEHKPCIFFGIKALKNSKSITFFNRAWKIIKVYWEEKGVPQNFIKGFEQEYITKKVQWHYGASFSGKSRSNNSVESGNKIIKDFYNRRAHNIKEFLGKAKDFVREWSTQEKTTFPLNLEYSTKVKKQALEIVDNAFFLESRNSVGFLYCTRKGVDTDEDVQEILEKHLLRNPLPDNADELFEYWGYFRTINVIHQTCDCAEFSKRNYCKHIIALKILSGEFQDPDIKEKKKKGRKPHITKALEK